MKHCYSILWGLLVALVWPAAFAGPPALITVDPNQFATGQNISSAISGTEFLVMTAGCHQRCDTFSKFSC
jgi:hypothetical protein